MAGAALESSGRCDSAELREEKFWPEEDWELSDSARRDSTELRFVTTSRAQPALRPRPARACRGPYLCSAPPRNACPMHRVPCTGVRAARDARRRAVGCWSAPRSCGRRRASAKRGRAHWRRSSRTMRCCRTARRPRSSRVRTRRTMTTSTPSLSRPTSSCELNLRRTRVASSLLLHHEKNVELVGRRGARAAREEREVPVPLLAPQRRKLRGDGAGAVAVTLAREVQ
jgi:hypothetical protein